MASFPDLGIDGIDDLALLERDGSPIYRARDVRDHRLVAIKLVDRQYRPLLPPRRFDPRRRPVHEFARAGGVVPICGTGKTRTGERYLMMPYYPAGSLADQLAHGSTPWHAAAELLVRVAEVLASGHRAGVVLTGIEPSSVLLADATSPLLAVYGMATRPVEDGRPSYRAPELARGADPEPEADVYSIGLTLAALIAGRNPGRARSHPELKGALENSVPDRIVDVVIRATEKHPADRYRNAGELAVRLRAAIEGEEIPVCPPAPGSAASAASSRLVLDDILVPTIEPEIKLEELAGSSVGDGGGRGSAERVVHRSPPPLPTPAEAATIVAAGTKAAVATIAPTPIIDLTDSALPPVATSPGVTHGLVDGEKTPLRALERQRVTAATPSRLAEFLDPLLIGWLQARRSLGAILAIFALLVVAGIVAMIALQQRQASQTDGGAVPAATTIRVEDTASTPAPSSVAPRFTEPPAAHRTSFATGR